MVKKPTYRVLEPIDYKVKGTEVTAEPGDVVDDLPHNAIRWLLDAGAIERVGS